MANVHIHAETPVPPERILAALTDFTDRRFDYWPNLDQRLYQVHATGDTWAEVTEGAAFAGGIWERGRYDWSTPGVVRLEVTDSNAFRLTRVRKERPPGLPRSWVANIQIGGW